jgi:hypothetical protein
MAFGVNTYWSDLWNRFDCLVTAASVTAFILDVVIANSPFFSLIQCLRLMRLFKIMSLVHRTENQRSDKIPFLKSLVDALTTSIPVCLNVLLILFFVLFSFAIIGMESLYKYDTNSKIFSTPGGSVNYIYNKQFSFDWAGTHVFSNFIFFCHL